MAVEEKKDESLKKYWPLGDKGNTKDESFKEISCLLYNGPYVAFKCFECHKLVALMIQEEKQE